MKKILAALFIVCVAASMSFAAINSNYASPVDVQGAHNNHGRGCTGCHVPHSGPLGNGNAADANITGNLALWGQSAGTLAGATLGFGDGGSWVETLPANDSATTPDLGGLLLCLTCHDGNAAKGAMMTGKVDWAAEGLNPTALGYASANVPTWLGNDGGSAGAGNYKNDHPVGLNAVKPTFKDEVVTVAGSKVTVTPTGPMSVAFAANYGFTASPSGYNNTAVVLCTTCHNQHVMTVYSGTIAGVKGYYQTQFGIRGYYNPAAGNSVAQFCRQCHGSHANETNNAMTIPTT
jgi:hypothetical protein